MNAEPVRSGRPVLLCSAIITVAETVMLALLQGWSLVAGHIVVCILCGWCAHAIMIRYADLSRPMLMLLLTAILGPVGSLSTVAILLLTMWHARTTVPFEDWYRALFPELEQNEQVLMWEQIIHEQEEGSSAIVPAFNDVLNFGTVAQKQVLVALVNRRFRPELGPILKRALRDEENAIRVQAATAISRLESEFLQDSLRLKRALGAAPEDVQLTLEMARLYDNFAFSGILDSKRQAETRDTALRFYRRYLELRPDDSRVMLTLARQELRNGNFKEALTLLDCAGEEGTTDNAILWRIECLYGLGQTDELRDLVSRNRERLESSSQLSNQAIDAVRLWWHEAVV